MRLLILLSTLIVSTVYNFFKPNGKNTVEASVASTEVVRENKTRSTKKAAAFEGKIADLTQGAWRMVSVVSDRPCDTDGDGTETTDIFSETPECAKDDIMQVYANHKVAFTRNQRCALTEKAVETYKWNLAKNGTFTIVDGSVEAVMVLKSVTPTQLVMEIPMEAQGEMYHFTVTYEQVNLQP